MEFLNFGEIFRGAERATWEYFASAVANVPATDFNCHWWKGLYLSKILLCRGGSHKSFFILFIKKNENPLSFNIWQVKDPICKQDCSGVKLQCEQN